MATAEGPLNLLALDGGGIRGVCEIVILQRIMDLVKKRMNLPKEPRPCDYFDLVGGTSTGGLIALMIGRFGMTASQCLAEYTSLAKKIFGKENRKTKFLPSQIPSQGGMFKATTLEKAVQDLARRSGEQDETRLLDHEESYRVRAFVLALPSVNVGKPQLLRTYEPQYQRSTNCPVWQAARATTAASSIFKPMSINIGQGITTEFIDAGLQNNNPMGTVLEEARECFGDNRRVRSILSIGTGHPGVIGMNETKVYAAELIGALKKLATDSIREHNHWATRFTDRDNLYFRFNLDHGAENVSLMEWNMIDALSVHVKAYMEDVPVRKAIHSVVALLCEIQHDESLPTLSSILRVPSNIVAAPAERLTFRPYGYNDPDFIERHDITDVMHAHSRRKSENHSKDSLNLLLLHGRPGSGKSQMCLRFFDAVEESFFHRLWVDGSSEETIEKDYLRMAEEIQLNQDKTVKSVILWLSQLSRQGIPWLVVFDNLYDQQGIENFLPSTSAGSGLVLVTSTKKFDKAIYALEIGPLEEEEAINLLFKVVRKSSVDRSERHSARILVKRLDRLPIAIKNAGSQIRQHKYTIHEFLEVWQKVFQATENNNQWQTGLVASLDMSYQRVLENASKYAIELLHFFAFLHSENASESILLDAREAVYVREDWNDVPLEILREVEFLKTPLSLPLFKYQVREALKALSDYSLLEFYGHGGVRIHSLIFNWIHHRLDNSGHQKWWKATATTVAISITKDTSTADKRGLIPHMDRLLDLDENAIFDIHLFQSRWDFEAAFQFADIYSVAGHFAKAYNLRQGIHERLTNCHDVFQANDPQTELMAKSLNLLAATCSDLGDHEAALKIWRQAIELEQEIFTQLEPMSERLIKLKLDEADSHWNLGRHELASQIRTEIHELRKSSISDQNFNFQESRAERDYAITLCNDGNPRKAAQLLEFIVKRLALHMEENDHQLLVSRSELARCYSEAGYEAKALIERQKIREIRESDDASHHDTLIAMQDLANSFSRLKMVQEAHHMRREIVDRFRSSKYGISVHHPSFLMAKYNFAQSLIETGDVKEAFAVHQAVLGARLKDMGENAPEVSASMLAVSHVLYMLARHDVQSASVYLRQALDIHQNLVDLRQKAVSTSDNHIDRVRQWLRARTDLAALYQGLKNFPISEIQRLDLPKDIQYSGLGVLNHANQLHNEILLEQIQLFGEEDSDTLQSMSEVGQAHFARAAYIERILRKEEYEIALSWFAKIDQLTEDADPRKVMAEKNIVKLYKKLGRLPEAIRILEKLLEMQSNSLGKDAVDTIDTAKKLWIEYRSQKHNADSGRKAEVIAAEYYLEKA